jgi:hypothetical protein
MEEARPVSRANSDGSLTGIASPSPMSRLQTHISFEELDDYVQIASVGKWEYKLTIAFPSVMLSPDMIVTVSTAVRQSVKTVPHDCNLAIDMDCSDTELTDDSLSKILSNAAPMAMRKSGRIIFRNLRLANNQLSDRTIEELSSVAQLNKDAKYKYKAAHAFGPGCVIDLSGNQIKSVDSLGVLIKTLPAAVKPPVLINASNNMMQASSIQSVLVDELKATVCGFEESDEDSTKCSGTRCCKNCQVHLASESLSLQREPEPSLADAEERIRSGFITPKDDSREAPHQPTIEEMTKALLAGLKITPDTSGPPSAEKKPVPAATSQSSSAEDISKSLLNLLHASANKLKAQESDSANVLLKSGRSLSEVESTMKQQATPPPQKYTAVRVPLRVFTPFQGATPLCGLELRVDPLGYRVIRVTEKPGQDGNIREGDVITAIDGEPLVALPGISDADREKTLRSTFGKRLRDGVQLIIQRPTEVNPSDLGPEPNTVVERRLDFGLMLLGAGIDWRLLISKISVAQQQALAICHTFGLEGKLETSGQGADASPVLVLKGPAGLVDKAMRQFCVVIVKAALLQQQQHMQQKEGKK